MTPERLEQIRKAWALNRDGRLESQVHRRELLAEVDRLNEHVERDGQTMQNQALVIARRDTENAELSAEIERLTTENDSLRGARDRVRALAGLRRMAVASQGLDPQGDAIAQVLLAALADSPEPKGVEL